MPNSLTYDQHIFPGEAKNFVGGRSGNYAKQQYHAVAHTPRLVHRNVIPMGIPWETCHGMGQHTFVFPMRQ